MTKDQLFKEACKRYPIGTVFESFGSFGRGAVRDHEESCTDSQAVWMNWDAPGANGQVYENGKWAPVISYPKGYKKPEAVINEYQIY